MNDDNKNTGDYNSGYGNSGTRNSGDYNSGNRNSGDCNSGDYNSGYGNSGYCNSGYGNSGTRNSGDYNSGNRNSGDCNSGTRNSGDCNSGDYNSGFFNTNEPTVRIFNKDSGKKRSELVIPCFYLKLTEWVDEAKMTNEQKKADPDFHVKGGTLIERSYHEAWALAWAEATAEVKQQFLDLPNFDAAIFKEITGIDVEKKSASCNGKVVEIDGKKYQLKEIE